MKKKISLLLTFALILSAAFSLFSVGVSAASYASDEAAIAAGCFLRIGEEGKGNYYSSFGDAGGACGSGQTIVMISDLTLKKDENQSFNAGGRNVTVDGNGHTLSGDRGGWIFATGGGAGTILIKNLVIENKGAGAVAQFNASSPVTLENVKIRHTGPDKEIPYGTVVVRTNLTLGEGTEITNNNTVKLDGQSNAIGLRIDAKATVTVCNGAKVETANSACLSLHDEAEVVVKGGVLSSTNNSSRAVVVVNKGKLTVEGGLITAESGFGLIHLESGSATVKGGALSSTTNTHAAILVGNGNLTVEGGLITAGGGYGLIHLQSGSATVNGGRFTPVNSNTVFGIGMFFVGSGSMAGGTLTINGGTFYYPKATATSPVIKAHESSDKNHKVVINGGDFVGTPYIYYGGNQAGSADQGKSVTVENPAVYAGASVRTAQDSNGIRFRSCISKAAMDAANAAKKQGTEIVYGTLIAPYESVVAAGGLFTREAMKAANKDFVDIVAKDGIAVNEDGSVNISAALVNLKPENIEREFVAVAYVSYETENGTVTVYANYNEEDHVRSMREIAYKALADVKTASEGYYQTVVSEWYVWENEAWVKKTGVAYSAYSEAQLVVIRNYIAA